MPRSTLGHYGSARLMFSDGNTISVSHVLSVVRRKVRPAWEPACRPTLVVQSLFDHQDRVIWRSSGFLGSLDSGANRENSG
jgi:hypothetical protein